MDCPICGLDTKHRHSGVEYFSRYPTYFVDGGALALPNWRLANCDEVDWWPNADEIETIRSIEVAEHLRIFSGRQPATRIEA